MQKSTLHGQTTTGIGSLATEAARVRPVASVLARITNYTRRNKLQALDELDDFMLADIGLTRNDIDWARELPLNRNPLAALDDLTKHRASQRRQAARRDLPGTFRA